MSCSGIQDLGYERFSAQLQQKIGLNRVPVSGSLEVTARCNLRCKHCYLPLSARSDSRHGELSLAEIQRIFSEIADEGCLWLLLTGGEPLLRSDFLDIYDDAKRKGFIITLFTNATMLSKPVVDHLAEWRPFSIQVTLYGATQATYEQVTGIPGSFARCMQGIEMILERNLPLKLRTILMTINHHELQQMREFSEGLGLEFSYDPIITGGINSSNRPAQYRLSPEQILSYDLQDEKRAAEWPKLYQERKGVLIKPKQLYACKAGHTGFHINSHGHASVCLMVRTPSYDLRQGNFHECWQDFFPSILAQELRPDHPCINCDLRATCMQCAAIGLTEFNDPQVIVPHLCELAHLRHNTFDSAPN